MCAACAMAAAAGASGIRSWLHVHFGHRLTPRAMRAVTGALVVAALVVSSVGLTGSGS